VKKLISIITLVVFIAGCGGSSNSRDNVSDAPAIETPPTNPTEVITMNLDESYQISNYDELNKTSNEAKVEIIHFEDGGTSVVLREGSATLTKY